MCAHLHINSCANMCTENIQDLTLEMFDHNVHTHTHTHIHSTHERTQPLNNTHNPTPASASSSAPVRAT